MKTIFPHALYGRGVLVEQWSGTTANASRPNTAPASPSDDADWASWHNQDNDDAVQPFRTTPSRRIRHTFCHLTPDGSAAKNAKGGNLIIRFPPSSSGGGCEIRTREAVTPTRFPSVRHRPLGESSKCTWSKPCNLKRIYHGGSDTQLRCVVRIRCQKLTSLISSPVNSAREPSHSRPEPSTRSTNRGAIWLLSGTNRRHG